jgi:hypothetical protein
MIFRWITLTLSSATAVHFLRGHHVAAKKPTDASQKNRFERPTMAFQHCMALVASLLLVGQTQAFYLPGVNPQSFSEGDT